MRRDSSLKYPLRVEWAYIRRGTLKMDETGSVSYRWKSKRKLLGAVWGAEFSGEVQYLRVSFARIRKKFEDIGFDGSVISAYSGVGYILRDLRDEDADGF